LHRDNSRAGSILAFGEHLNCHYDLSKADVIVSLEADFLGSGPAHLRYARQFAARRRLTDDSKTALMNRLYVVESSPTITGAAADHRLALPSREIGAFGCALVLELLRREATLPQRELASGLATLFPSLKGLMSPAEEVGGSRWDKWLRAIADDVLEQSGR